MNLPSTFTYNGMLKTNEIAGEGNSFQTEFRQYDSRLGKWLSLDPLMEQFPWMSPFVGFDNNPILYVDPYGLESTNPDGDNPGILGSERPPCDGMDGYGADELNNDFDEGSKIKKNKMPSMDQYVGVGMNSSSNKINNQAQDLSNKYPGLKSYFSAISNYSQKVSNYFQKNENYVPFKSGNDIIVEKDENGIDGVGEYYFTLKMWFQTTNSSYNLTVSLPVYEITDNDNKKYEAELTIQSVQDIKREWTNCYAVCLGIYGLVDQTTFELALEDDYFKVNKKDLQVGDIIFDKESDHAMIYMGQKNGEQIFKSGTKGVEPMIGTYKEILESQGLDMKSNRGKWYKGVKAYRKK